ncbi:MAG: hypothetical protein ACYTFW_13620 [Planctomycetota bacterium]
MKKQSQFIRIAYCVLRIAKSNLKKQNQTQPLAGNPKHEALNPKQDGWTTNDKAELEKTKPISK